MKRLSKKAWFKPKNLGWWLTPNTWQGWVSLAIFVIAIAAGGLYIYNHVFIGVLILVLAVIFLTVVAYLTGDEPKQKKDTKS